MHSHSSAAPATEQAPYPEVYRNMMAVGLLGATYKAHDDAGIVNAAVESTLADPTHFRMCRAIAQGIGGDGEYAAAALDRHIERHPDDDGAKVAMAVAMMLAGKPEWKSLIDNVLAVSTDQNAREAANGVISYLAAMNH